jgi:preprotein translocase subunit SecA
MIDEARVPMVLAGATGPPPVDPRGLTALAERLVPGRDLEVDEYARNLVLTEEGLARAEAELGVENLHRPAHRPLLTALNLALHARVLLRRDVDYIVREGRVEVVDEFTGRVVPDRRWPDGLHCALEAKEGVEVRPEGTVLQSLPLQHFFRLYPGLAGMTATAAPAAAELHAFYGLEVAVIPPHRPRARRDEPDLVFADRASKRQAVVEEAAARHARGQPVLIGTASVAESEELSGALGAAGIPHRVLNARNDEQEAAVIAEAGSRAAVTLSTNMAGRGTDIRLGGASERERAEIAALGGLRVIGTNRHESRRVDDQLRGRAGRQGDPGSSRFFVSLEDDLVDRYGIAEAVVPLLEDHSRGRVETPAAAAEIERAQRIIEGQNFEIRRTLWSYSSMVEEQRRILAGGRERALLDPSAIDLFARRCPERHARLRERLGPEAALAVEQRLALLAMDRAWSDHLARLADVREGLHLHQLAGLDWFGGIWGLRKTPLDVFHQMAVEAFDRTLSQLEERAVAACEALEESAEGIDLERDDLQGPRSTWTYLVSDTPFESTIIRIYRGVSRRVRGD